MGAIHFSLDPNLLAALREHLPLTAFVETGTFRGETAARAAALFERVHTIELSPQLHAAAVERLRPHAHVRAHHGESPRVLREIVPELAEHSVVYWLDAHWCGEGTAGAAFECPLLDEFAALGTLNERSVVLVDDARLFLAAPPAPHDAAAWPQLADVVDGLRRLNAAHALWVVNDVIVFAPRVCTAGLVDYSRRHGVDLHALALRAGTRPAPAGAAPVAPVGTPTASAQSPSGDIETTFRLDAPAAAQAPSEPAFTGFNADVERGGRAERIFVRHLERLGIGHVLDVGAHEGQFASKLRRLGYPGAIYSVEPQRAPYAALAERARGDARWFPLARQAAGARREAVELNVAANGWSSSVREVHDNHLRAAATTRVVGRESVRANRVVDMLDPDVLRRIEAVKIDVQGYEDAVLEGLLPHLPRVRLLLVELSMVECYRGAPDMFALDARLVREFGFERVSLEPAYYDEGLAVAQQYDGIYRRAAGDAGAVRAGADVHTFLTSVGGSAIRPGPDGTDLGPDWQQFCAASWAGVAQHVVSVSESTTALAGVRTVRTAARPSLREMFAVAARDAAGHVLLANADVAITETMRELCAAADPVAVYYGCRLEVQADPSNRGTLVARGTYEWGFDWFLLPPEFVRRVAALELLPADLRVGEPWWDYLLPVVALSLGFPTKRFDDGRPLAVHLAHPARYAHRTWLDNGRVFLDLVERLRARGDGSADGVLDDLLAHGGELEPRLHAVARTVCKSLP